MITKRRFLAAAAVTPLLNVAFWECADAAFVVRKNRLFLDVAVNGHRVRALLDSAAETSLLDTKFAQAIGIGGGRTVAAHGSGGDTDAQLAKGVMIDVLGLHIGPLTVGVLDLSDVGRRLLDGPLSFVMGRELFDATRLYIDIDRADIHALPLTSKPAGAKLTLHKEHGIETLSVAIEGKPPVEAAFDLGNGSDVLVGAAYAKDIGLLTDGRSVVEGKGGGLGGEVRRPMFVLKSLEIAGRRFEDVTATIDANSTATNLNVGVSILRQFEIVTDFSAHCVWLKSK